MKWEYKKVSFSDLAINGAIQIDGLNKLGEQEWEMVAITNWQTAPAFLYFKRPKEVTTCEGGVFITRPGGYKKPDKICDLCKSGKGHCHNWDCPCTK